MLAARRPYRGKPPSVRLLPLWEKVPEGRMRGRQRARRPYQPPPPPPPPPPPELPPPPPDENPDPDELVGWAAIMAALIAVVAAATELEKPPEPDHERPE